MAGVSRSNKDRIKENKLSLFFKSSVFFSLAGLFGLPAPVVVAQDSGSMTLDEIVVTAQKREQNLQDIPVSITAISEESIGKFSVKDFAEIADSVPGLTFATTGVGNSNYYIRGIGAVSQDQSPTTGVYLDEIPLNSRNLRGISQPDPQLFDLERVEVLRGPQGVLFGSSAMGGLIRVVTRKPDTNEFSGSVVGTASTIAHGSESWDTKGMVNLPLVEDKLALRLVGVVGKQGGWIDDLRPTTTDILENVGNDGQIKEDINSNDYKMGRVSLKWTPTDTLSITPSILFQETNSNTDRYHSDEDFGSEGYTKARWIDTHFDDEFVLAGLEINKDVDIFGGASIVSATSYQDRQTEMLFDATMYWSGRVEAEVGAPPGDLLYPTGLLDNSDTKQFSQEIRLISTHDEPLQYVVGGFFKDLDQTWSRGGPVLELFGATPTGAFASTTPPTLEETLNTYDEKEYALFGELSYDISDNVEIAVGGRFVWYDLTDSRQRYEVGGPAGGNLTYMFTEKADETAFTPRVRVSYSPLEEATFYASYSQGLRAGGVNAPIADEICSPAERAAAGLPDTPPPFESDKTNNYEVGAKTNFADGAVSLNAALYRIDWTDYQQNVQAICGVDQPLFFIANAGEVRSQGIEVEFVGHPVEGLALTLGGSYTDAEYVDGSVSLGLGPGSRLLDVPKVNLNWGADWVYPLAGGWEGNLGYFGRHVGDSISGFGEGLDLERPAYTLHDLVASMRRETLTISVFVKNLTDEVAVYGQEFAANPETTTAQSFFAYLVGPPRTLGLKIAKDF